MPKDKWVGQERKGPVRGVVEGGKPGVKERIGVRGVGLGLFSPHTATLSSGHNTVK